MGRWGDHVKDIVVCLFFCGFLDKKNQKKSEQMKDLFVGGVLRHPPKKQGCANVQIVAQTCINTSKTVFREYANKSGKFKTFACF